MSTQSEVTLYSCHYCQQSLVTLRRKTHLVQNGYHWRGEETPSKELEEDDDERVVDGGLADPGRRDDALGDLLRRVAEYHVHHLLPHLKVISEK